MIDANQVWEVSEATEWVSALAGFHPWFIEEADCSNFPDFRRLAERRLPRPIFGYIDGAADNELTYRRNTESFANVDLVPNVLRGVEDVDLSVTVIGQKLARPVYYSPTALQQLFHHDGEHAVGAAAAKFGTMFGVSSPGTASLEEVRATCDTPQVYQFSFHKDRRLTNAIDIGCTGIILSKSASHESV